MQFVQELKGPNKDAVSCILPIERDGYIGEVFMTGSNFCPRNTLPTDGRLLPISQNTALFSLLGTMYGGDGRTTFALPKLEGPRAGSDSANANQKLTVCIVTQGIFPSRS